MQECRGLWADLVFRNREADRLSEAEGTSNSPYGQWCLAMSGQQVLEQVVYFGLRQAAVLCRSATFGDDDGADQGLQRVPD